MCAQTADALADCSDESWAWEDVGASNRTGFINECQADWQDVASDLGARDLELALADCKHSSEFVDDLPCDELLGLYTVP